LAPLPRGEREGVRGRGVSRIVGTLHPNHYTRANFSLQKIRAMDIRESKIDCGLISILEAKISRNKSKIRKNPDFLKNWTKAFTFIIMCIRICPEKPL